MTESGSRLEGKRDANKAREKIVDAAEAIFAESGFHGARTDAIVKSSGYNVSLLYQYFGDKLGLYAEVLKRADRDLNALLTSAISPLLSDETIVTEAQRLKTAIATMAQTTFDYLINHPRLLRILTWEMAEGWQTYQKIASQFITGESDPFEPLFARARRAGLLRSDFPGVIQLTLVFQMCQSYLAFLPVYQMELPGEDVSSATALTRARERLAAWVVGATINDLPNAEAVNPNLGGKPRASRRSSEQTQRKAHG